MYLKKLTLKNSISEGNKMDNEELKAALEYKLKVQDWFYQYSDDMNVYNKGNLSYKELSSIYSKYANATSVEEAKKIWNSYCPQSFRRQ